MRILVINGNTTPQVTASIELAAMKAALPGTEIHAVTPSIGPATVEGYLDGQLSAIGVCEEIALHQQNADVFVIACFSDPGLYAAREFSEKPVIGIAEAAMLTAVQLGHTFGLITPQRRLHPVLQDLVNTYGFSSRLAGIQIVDMNVAEAATAGPEQQALFRDAARRSIEEDGAEAVILAGAVLSGLEDELSRDLAMPVIDPVKCAVGQAQALVAAGFGFRSGRAFPSQQPKECPGCPSGIFQLVYSYRDTK